MPTDVELTVSAKFTPVSGGVATGTGSLPAAITRRYARHKQPEQLRVVGTDGAPQVYALGSIVRGRFLYVRVVAAGEVRVRLTTPDGVAQVIPVSDLLVLHNPTDGSEFTAVTLAATAATEVEIAAAGDDAAP